MTRFSFSLILLAGLILVACDPETTPVIAPSQTDCTANEAQIRISDGFFENLCGCTEVSAIVESGPFTCTVKTGTTVFFLYIDTHLSHQIISTGGESFASGTVNFPGANSANNNVVAEFNTAGTADFEDAFNTGIQGQIVITP